jgi:hypothetical protein
LWPTTIYKDKRRWWLAKQRLFGCGFLAFRWWQHLLCIVARANKHAAVSIPMQIGMKLWILFGLGTAIADLDKKVLEAQTEQRCCP